ncbi:MAG: phosphoserine phosphatase SerB [Neisseria sp.]|nr:phosphoserine phosphatase SerB [Neisseria sp.]
MAWHLVLQHPNLPACDLSLLTDTPAETSVLRVPSADGIGLSEAVERSLTEQNIEFAMMPDVAFADLGLVVSDMDSTLITIECIDEIAVGVGLKEQVAEITELSMRGELDFEQSLRRRVALLKGLPEQVLHDVYDNVLQLSAGAEYFLAECKKHQVKFMLVSGGFTFFTERLKQRLGLDYAYGNELEIKDGVLTGELIGKIIDAQAKADLLEEYRVKLGLKTEQVLAMGDGANDIPMLKTAGFGVAFHAKPKTQAAADICVHHYGLETIRHFFK